MFFLHIQAMYNFFGLVFSWFALANIWLTFSIVTELVPQSTHINLFVTTDVVSDLPIFPSEDLER